MVWSDSNRVAFDRSKQFNPQVQHQPVSQRDPVQHKQPVVPQPQRNNNLYQRPSIDTCYQCRQPGHHSNTCPNQRQANLVGVAEDDPADFGNEGNYGYEDQNDDEEVQVVEGDHGDRIICVVQRLLYAPKHESYLQDITSSELAVPSMIRCAMLSLIAVVVRILCQRLSLTSYN